MLGSLILLIAQIFAITLHNIVVLVNVLGNENIFTERLVLKLLLKLFKQFKKI